MKRVIEALDKGIRVGTPNIQQAIFSLAVEGSGADLLAATTGIMQRMKAHPNLFTSTPTDMETQFTEAYMRALEMGKLTYEEIRAKDADAFAGFDTDFYLQHRIFFDAPRSLLIRSQGNKAASDQCAALAVKASEVQKNAEPALLRRFEILRDLECMILKVELKEANGIDVMNYFNALSAPERGAYADNFMKIFALTGTNFNEATQIAAAWKASYEKAYAKYPELLARIQKATDERLAAYQAGKSHP
jgi:hypothetical protein